MENKKNIYHYIARILDGETACFAHIVDQYGSAIYTLIVQIIGNREEAEELTQDTFMKIYTHLYSFRQDSNFSTWIYRIAYNTAISHARKKKYEYLSVDDETWQNISEETLSESLEQHSNSLQLEWLDKALAMLSEEEQTLIHLFYKEKKSTEEIGYIVGQTVSNIKVKLFRSRKKLLVLMKQMEENSDE